MQRVVAPRGLAWRVEADFMGAYIGLGLRTAEVALAADLAADLTCDLMLALREHAGNLTPGAEPVH